MSRPAPRRSLPATGEKAIFGEVAAPPALFVAVSFALAATLWQRA